MRKQPKYLLDTNIVSFAINADWNKPEDHRHWVSRRIRSNVSQCYLPVISTQELFYGMHHKSLGAKRSAKINSWVEKLKQLAFDAEAAKIAGTIKATLTRQGIKPQELDIQIAAIALSKELVLVTNNVKHFEHIPNLKIENWTDMKMSRKEFFEVFIYTTIKPLKIPLIFLIILSALPLLHQTNRVISLLSLTMFVISAVFFCITCIFQPLLVSFFLKLNQKNII